MTGEGAGCLPERTPEQQGRANEATLEVQNRLAAERLEALKASPDGRRLLAASEESTENGNE